MSSPPAPETSAQGGASASRSQPLWQKLLLRLQRSPVAWTVAVTTLRAGGFIFVLPVMLRKVPTAEVGLWYVFLGLTQIAGIVEFGFAPTISRFASYYWSGARSVPGLGLSAEVATGEPNVAAIHGLIDMAKRLYLALAAATGMLIFLGGGLWLYLEHYETFWNVRAVTAFGLFATGTVINMLGYFWTGLLYGVGRVRDQQRILLAGLCLNYLVALIGLGFGAGLIALAAGQFVLGLYPRWRARRIVEAELPTVAPEAWQRVSWRELWPMTWRSGLGSSASYLALGIITLITAKLIDLRAAASVGLSFQLATVIYAQSGSWLAVTYPRLSAMRARGQLRAVRQLVAQRMLLSCATFLCGATVAWFLAPSAIQFFRSNTTFLPPALLALLFAAVAVEFFAAMHAAVMQTGNDVPYLGSYMFTGLLCVSLSVLLGKIFGLVGIVAAPLMAQLCWNAWYTPWRCWRDLRAGDRRA